MHLTLATLGLVAAALVLTASAVEAGTKRAKQAEAAVQKRDCTPINGRFGYYGNPWCDTGSYRQKDIQFREKPAKVRRTAN